MSKNILIEVGKVYYSWSYDYKFKIHKIHIKKITPKKLFYDNLFVDRLNYGTQIMKDNIIALFYSEFECRKDMDTAINNKISQYKHTIEELRQLIK